MSDNLCKLLSEKYPNQLASWVLGTPQSRVEVLKTELSIEPIRADSVIFLQVTGGILHLEFQTRLASTPPLPLRMLDYWVRLYRLYRLPVTQVVVLLLPPAPGTLIETAFVMETTRHEYRVICLWEQNPDNLLNDPVLLPFASLAASSEAESLLQQVAQRVNQLESPQLEEVLAYTKILAGLKFEKELIQRLFREDIMEESVIYQDILERGLQRGVQQGLQRGVQQGLQQGRQEGERSLTLRLLTRRVGEIPEAMRSRVDTLSIEQLENLGEALLDFKAFADLEAWFEALESPI